MEWNKEQINDYYKKLKNESLKSSSKEQKFAYTNDLNNLYIMNNYIYQKKLLPNKKNEVLFDETYYNKVLEWFHKYGYKLLYNTRIYNDVCLNNTFYLKNRVLSEENISRLTYLFLKDYNEELKDELYHLNDKSQIYYDNRKCKKTIGETFNIINMQDSFILLHKSDKLDSPLVLTREVTKAHDFKNKCDIKSVQDRAHSPFAYANANFNELVMLDRMDEYTDKEKLQIKIDYLNNILSLTETFDNNLLCLNHNNRNSCYFPNIIKNVMSNILAIYWYNNFKENEIATMKEIESFNSRVGINDIDLVDDKMLTEVFKTFDNYVNEVSISRTRK